MKRLALLWLVFGVCVAVLLGAMAWVSYTVIRLERAEREAQRTALVEENVRLALWRMDSLVTPLVAQEAARPYWMYSAFAPVEGVYGKMFNEIPRGEVLAPSPLLSAQSPLILVHCEIQGTDAWSPQAPTGNMRDLATRYTTRERIAEAEVKLARLRELLSRPEVLAALPRETMEMTWTLAGPGVEAPAPQQEQDRLEEQQEIQVANDLAQAPQMQQQARNTIELRARSRYSQSANNYEYLANRSNFAAGLAPAAPEVKEGVMKPLWVEGELILARRVLVNGVQRIQGCWLNWAEIEKSLLGGVRDLLPAAALVKVPSSSEIEQSARRLAAIPVRLVPGAVHVQPETASPVRLTLFVAWLCALLGATAVALLLWGAIRLSERRGAFVSAVTHELRTPLTTVSMYAEMLEEGMVSDEGKRRHYLSTLRAEAERLGHLVENVLAYSRIERGKMSNRIQPVRVRELIESTEQRLAARAEQAGLKLESDLSAAADATVLADPAAVEQILFNLVDNAAKYARAADARVHLEAHDGGSTVRLVVRDHGPGITAPEARKLFRPFSKSAKDAANSAPGVGLGLALSRRLAREMKGDLSLQSDNSPGACFVLELRRA